MTHDEFTSFFEQFGPVLDSIVMVDRNTMRSRGFGFVTFKNPETSRKVLEMGATIPREEGSTGATPQISRLEMGGKMIEIKPAEPKESSRRQNRMANHRYNYQDMTYAPSSPPFPADVPFPSPPADFGNMYAHAPYYPLPPMAFPVPMYYPVFDQNNQQQPPIMSGGAAAPMHPAPVMMDGYFASQPYIMPPVMQQQQSMYPAAAMMMMNEEAAESNSSPPSNAPML